MIPTGFGARLTLLWAAVAVLALALSGAAIRIATTTAFSPDVLDGGTTGDRRTGRLAGDGPGQFSAARGRDRRRAGADGGSGRGAKGCPFHHLLRRQGRRGRRHAVRSQGDARRIFRGPAPVPGCEQSGSDRGPCALSGSGGIDIGPHNHRPAGSVPSRLPCTTGPFRRRVERATADRDRAASRGWKGGSAAGAVRNRPRLSWFDSWRRGQSHAPGWRGASTHRHRSARRRRTVHPAFWMRRERSSSDCPNPDRIALFGIADGVGTHGRSCTPKEAAGAESESGDAAAYRRVADPDRAQPRSAPRLRDRPLAGGHL